MTDPVPILILTTSYPRSAVDDAGIFVKRLIDAMSTSGLSGTVLVPYDSIEPEQEVSGNFTIKRFRYGIFGKGVLAFGSGIIPNIKQNPGCALQAPALLLLFAFHAFRLRKQYRIMQSNWAITALPAFLVFLVTRTPYIITLRGEDLRLLRKPFFKVLLALPFRYARAVTCVNHSNVLEVIGLYESCREKTCTIANGVQIPTVIAESENFLTENPEFLNGKIALFVGTIVVRKQIGLLIEALSNPLLSEWKLVLIGRISDTTYVESLLQAIAAASLSDRVFIKGLIAPQHIPEYMRRASAYVSASAHEGRPNSVLEALAIGLPVLLSDIAAHKEITNEYHAGMLFQSGDATDLAQKLATLSLERAPVPVRSWKAAAADYHNCFQELLTSKK